MDTSKEYIEMCEVAEIQKLWEATNGDWFVAEYTIWNIGQSVLSESKDPLATMVQKRQIGMTISDPMIWLPRQDQLQKMVNENNLTALLQDFISWLSKQCNLPMHNTSMEQLWLAFVMKEKYNKTWDGKEWE